LEEWDSYKEAVRRYKAARKPGEVVDIFDPDLPVPPPGYIPMYDGPPPSDQ